MAVDVSLQVSEPYRRTDFMLVLNILSLVLVFNALLLHTDLEMTKLAVLFFFMP